MDIQFDRPIRFDDPNAVAEWMWQQLQKIEEALNDGAKVIQIAVSYEEPEKLTDGMVVLADGTEWEPVLAGGQGYYGYYAGAWHKLG